jgi:nucleoside-diphosphate-sugar epimerase
MMEEQPEIVVHLAALPSAKESTMYPQEAVDINVDGVLSMLESIRRTPTVKRFVFASSSFVYGHFQSDVADETHPTDPIDVYGGTKLTGEILTKAYARQLGFEYVIVRPSAVYGFGDVNRRVSQIIVEKALRGEPIGLHNGGRARIDFTHVTDIADGFLLAATHPDAANQTFNMTRGRAREVREFAEVVASVVPGVQLNEEPADMSRPNRGTLSIDKAKSMLGYSPKVDIEEGAAQYVRDMMERGPEDLRRAAAAKLS